MGYFSYYTYKVLGAALIEKFIRTFFFSNLSLKEPMRYGIYYSHFKIFFWNTAVSYPVREKYMTG
jgi:hypothetical protein